MIPAAFCGKNRFLVRVGRLELPASSSQSWRAASCATPGYSFFSFCRCGQRPMFEQIAREGKCGNPSNYKGLRDFGFLWNAGGVTRSQTTRAPSCATPGFIKFLVISVSVGYYVVVADSIKTASLPIYFKIFARQSQHRFLIF